MIIFLEIYFSALGLITKSDQFSLSIVVFVYSMICLFSYFNITYIRDFEAISVSFTTYMLAVATIVAVQHSKDLQVLGMSIALVGDSYFALRFKADSDEIKYTPIENFARQSWTA